MPSFSLLTGTVEQSYGGLPTLPLVNLFAEKAITEPRQFTLRSRPKLQKYLSSAWGSAVPIRALNFVEDGAGGKFFGVFSTSFYQSGGTSTTLNGDLIPSIASNEIGVVATAGSAAKWWDYTTFRSISFPDSADVTKVLTHEGRFIFLRAQSQKYYWTEPLSNMVDGSGDMVIDGAAFASAENSPDWLVDGLVWKDRLVLGGTKTIEIPTVTGDDNLPYNSVLGGTINRGVFGTGAMALFDSSFAWVSPERAVWRYNGSDADKISDAGIEEVLKTFGTVRLDSFFLEGREFLHIWDEGGGSVDLFMDASNGQWCEWETDGAAFDGGPSVGIGTDYPLFGAKSDTRILGMSTRDVLAGGGWETNVEHRFRFGIPIDGGSIPISNVLLRCQTYGSATGTISLRTSRDKGQTWSSWKTISFNGSLRQKIEWRALGMADSPGYLCEVKTSGLSEFSVSGASFNEFVAGRSRG